jgi:hypothetical protein|tara:strand:+ start:358 stop:696 length:339 start_codon:yes stop_codon:yes gene_type:complete
MKKIIYLFALSILFQSCFSYKTIEYDNINSEKKQTFRIEKDDRTKIKGKLVSKDDKKIIIKKSGKTQTVLKENIEEIRVKKFSIIRTAAGAAGTYAAALVIGAVVFLALLAT